MRLDGRRGSVALAVAAAVSIQACVSGAPGPGEPSSARPPDASALLDRAAPSGSPVPACEHACASSPPRYVFRDVVRRASSSRLVPIDTWGTLWADYDADGDPDLLVGRHERAPDFLVNDGGAYAALDVDLVHPPGYDPLDEESGVDRHSCAWGEADGDGHPDLYCTVGANRGTGVGPNQLFLRRSGGFREVAAAYGVDDPFGRSKSVNWLDHDGDGDLDLFVGNAMRLDRPAPNALFERTADGFVRTRVGLDDELVTMSSSWADWDSDGDPDLLVLQYPSSSRPAFAYENVDGSYREATLAHVTGARWHAAAWGDYDGDGRPDLAVVAIERLAILRNTRRGLQPVFDVALDKGQMAVWFDAENDGDLDLFVVQGAPPPMEWTGANVEDFLVVRERRAFRRVDLPALRGPVDGCGDSAAAADHDRDGLVDLFITNGAEGGCRGLDVLLENRSAWGNWVAIDLDGGLENPWGFGARIRVRAGTLSYWRQLNDGVNFRSQSEVGHQVLGIGRGLWADVRVIWPDGTSDCATIPAGATWSATKGSSTCRA